MLTREELARLSPAECAAACEELDQNILSTLQSIDSNFVETTRIVTDVLIPIIEKYGRSSKQIWDSVKVGPPRCFDCCWTRSPSAAVHMKAYCTMSETATDVS